MFWNNIGKYRSKDPDNVVDIKLGELSKNMQKLDKGYADLDETEIVKRLANLKKQSELLRQIQDQLNFRTVRIIDRYMQMWDFYESQRKDATERWHDVDKDTKKKVEYLKQANDSSELNRIMENHEKEKKLYENKVKDIDKIEHLIKFIKNQIEDNCKNAANSAKIISENK